jgi:hypothetical protein
MGLAVARRLGVEQHCAQDDEVAEAGVDDVAVDAHAAQAGGDSDRLVGDDPDLAGEAAHLHREAGRGVQGLHALLLQGGDDLAGDLVGVVVAGVELQVRGGAGRAADRPPVHPADEAEERFGVREGAQDVGPLVVQGGAADLDQAGVVGPAVQAQLAQPGRIEQLRRFGVVGAVALTESQHGRVFGQVHDAASFIAYTSIVRKKHA